GTAERLGLRVHQPEKPELPEDVERVVVAAYGLYIPPRVLERSLFLNVHPSLLPRWRGAAPVERAILAADEETGVTIHQTIAELDAGPVAAQERFAIGELDAGEIFERAGETAGRLLHEVIDAPRSAPRTPSCCAASRTTRTPTARSPPPWRGSTTAIARSRSGWRTAPSSARGRSTSASSSSASVRCGSSIRRCARRCASAPTSSH